MAIYPRDIVPMQICENGALELRNQSNDPAKPRVAACFAFQAFQEAEDITRLEGAKS